MTEMTELVGIRLKFRSERVKFSCVEKVWFDQGAHQKPFSYREDRIFHPTNYSSGELPSFTKDAGRGDADAGEAENERSG